MKKICIVADVPNWAFDSIAKKLKKDLSYKYEITVEYFNRRAEAEYFYEFTEKVAKYDLVHFLNRRILLLMGSEAFREKVQKSGRSYEEYVAEKQKFYTTSVYDYLDTEPEVREEYAPIYNKYTKRYYVATKKLFEIYSSIPEYKKPDAMVHDICDKESFPPLNLERFEYENIKNREIVIGWVGNSKHNDEKEVDLKGFHSVIKPAIAELMAEGYALKEHYADKNIKLRAPNEMPQYYSEIDLCICASIHEGTPRPCLESMYSGVPFISTDVGLVGEALGEKQHYFIIGDRENGKNDENIRRNLKEKIVYLYNHRELFKELSEENMERIEIFDGGKTLKAFDDFFEQALN